MNDEIRADWQRAIDTDPRIGQLADAACEILRTAEPGRRLAASMYGDVRQYLERLVGYARTLPLPDGSRTRMDAAHERFTEIITRPVEIDATDDEFLGGDRAYDVTHDVIFTRLCEIEERDEESR
ncbi:hypothetical protein [Actinoplanes sp. NPDC051494]|uniref:hypothetical protein n=1 Tax=Actinoplanes sp. NPDC051494 TaxID=3363907 RepID=UPI0037963F50